MGKKVKTNHTSETVHETQVRVATFLPKQIPCVFPEFSLCYINYTCVIVTQKPISPMNKGHITTVLHTEVYKLIFKVWII